MNKTAVIKSIGFVYLNILGEAQFNCSKIQIVFISLQRKSKRRKEHLRLCENLLYILVWLIRFVNCLANEWVKSCLSKSRKFIKINENKNASLEKISCNVLQGSILGQFIFLLYVRNLKNTSKLLDLIMLADDTNLFLHTKILFIYFK